VPDLAVADLPATGRRANSSVSTPTERPRSRTVRSGTGDGQCEVVVCCVTSAAREFHRAVEYEAVCASAFRAA